jgi:putative SOS response-associated peptidase YedK
MCGRYSLASPPAKVRLSVPFTGDEALLQPRFNLAPTQAAAVVLPSRELKLMRWGLTIPAAHGSSTLVINARSETAGLKPAFKKLMAEQRCLVLADGFYEWQKGGKIRQPYRFRLKTREPFAFAGVWGNGPGKEGGGLGGFVILTTQANRVVRPCHDRMPVILGAEQCAAWLSPGNWPRCGPGASFFAPLGAEGMECYPVTPKLNDPRFEGPECFERWHGMAEPLEFDFG